MRTPSRWVAYAGFITLVCTALLRPRLGWILRSTSWTLLPSSGGPRSGSRAAPVPEPVASDATPPASGAATPPAGRTAVTTLAPAVTANTTRPPAAAHATTQTAPVDAHAKLVAHFDLVHRFFDESARVHGPNASALYGTFYPKKPAGASALGRLSEQLKTLYPRTYRYASRFVYFQSLHPEIVKPGKVKLLILTLTMSHELGSREVHRRTWMSRPGICVINATATEEPKNCRAYAAFAPGWAFGDTALNELVEQEGRRYGDITRVDARDPNATGHTDKKLSRHKEKDLAMLLYASKHWPWVTHIGKNDLDDYPQVDLILRDIEDPQGMRIGASNGVPPEGWLKDPTRPIYYGALMGGQPKKIVQTTRGSFIQGQFYAISRSLMACVMDHLPHAPSEYVHPIKGNPPSCSYELEGDQVWGCLVRLHTVDHKHCPTPWWISVRFAKPGRWHQCKP
mmetsp:Transcript_102005/g.304337  ORF Transcript_102005/g.304337 Transcript_102005/m.304337 type:complete len:454 (-) Transcript_102005:40-1401(-)